MKHVCLTVNILVITIVFSAPGCTSSKHKGEGRVYDKKNGFSIIPPSGWENNGEFMGNFMSFLGPQEGDFAVNFNANVNKHDGSSIEQAGAQVKPVFKRLFTDYESVYDGFVTIDDRKCYYLSSRLTMGTFRIQNLQYYMLTEDKKKVYAVTFTATVETFDKYKSIFEKTALTARTD